MRMICLMYGSNVRIRPKPHAKACRDKCGCYKPQKNSGKISIMNSSVPDIDNLMNLMN